MKIIDGSVFFALASIIMTVNYLFAPPRTMMRRVFFVVINLSACAIIAIVGNGLDRLLVVFIAVTPWGASIIYMWLARLEAISIAENWRQRITDGR